MAEVKLSFRFVVVFYVLTTAHICYADSSRPLVKSIKSPDGDIIDCVHISNQPAFDHPLLKNHTIKMGPNYHPSRINLDGLKVSSTINASKDGALSPYVTQLWHSNGKCPKGTVPVRRTNKEDVLMRKSVSIAQPRSIGAKLDVGERHEHAIAYTNGKVYGAKATLNVWNPKVEGYNEFSSAHILIRGSIDSDFNIIAAGWHVYPHMYGDTNTRFFITWTNDGHATTVCYNLRCSGFIQINNNIAIGASISPISQMYGSQYEITILIWKDPQSEDWWLQLGDEQIGYWPSSLFSYLSASASQIQWGGEVVNSRANGYHTTTEMGSGRFSNQGLRKASYIRNIETVDESNHLWTPNDLYTITDQNNCYDISSGIDDIWGNYFYFGGPGRNTNCL